MNTNTHLEYEVTWSDFGVVLHKTKALLKTVKPLPEGGITIEIGIWGYKSWKIENIPGVWLNAIYDTITEEVQALISEEYNQYSEGVFNSEGERINMEEFKAVTSKLYDTAEDLEG